MDKFNDLNSFLEATAADTIACVTLTSANYAEAVTTLKKWLGNMLLVASRHMDAFLNLPIIGSHQDLNGL